MSYIAKPSAHHPALPRNALGLTRRDYEGSMSTLCAGCGHDSITAAIVQAFFELDIAPHGVATNAEGDLFVAEFSTFGRVHKFDRR